MKYSIGPYRNTELPTPRAGFDPEGYCVGIAIYRQIIVPVEHDPGRGLRKGPGRAAVLNTLGELKSAIEIRITDTIMEIQEGEFVISVAGSEGGLDAEEVVGVELVTPTFQSGRLKQ